VRQFASVTSLSREGGKSSIKSADILSHFDFVRLAGAPCSGPGTRITFRRGLNLILAMVDPEHSHKT
jgi:hypothetical protein